MIYTSYFSNLNNIPSNIVPIAICGKSPSIWLGRIEYKKLAPKWSFFKEWKINHDNDYYIEHFYDEVLNKLDPNVVVKELYELSLNKDVVLMCYEKPTEFCHRHLVANWLNQNGYPCIELK